MPNLTLMEEHKGLGARLTKFNGWIMPLLYTNIIEEHMHVRTSAGLFDVSHMGKLIIYGKGSYDMLNSLSTNKLPSVSGRSRYTHLTNDEGNTIDDVIITKLNDDTFLCVCNSGSDMKVQDWIASQSHGQNIKNITQNYVLLAIQGPESEGIIENLSTYDIKNLKRFQAALVNYQTAQHDISEPPPETMGSGGRYLEDFFTSKTSTEHLITITSRTGYTGEDGFEVLVDKINARELWKALLDSSPEKVRPIGIGARDTLRLEMGYLLAGNDFDGSQNPIEMGLERIIKWDHQFKGRSTLEAKKGNISKKLVGLLSSKGKAIPRRGMRILSEGKETGKITSGTLSPTLKRGIGLGYVDLEFSNPGTELHLDIRGRREAIMVAETPFIKRM